ncbi:hypothetical protein L1887_01158 [Cichorium endivia]|nr:hypothetical protein L1887_01158 [Cichorium endivia]
MTSTPIPVNDSSPSIHLLRDFDAIGETATTPPPSDNDIDSIWSHDSITISPLVLGQRSIKKQSEIDRRPRVDFDCSSYW